MTEDYLHFLWNNKRILAPDLTLVNGNSLTVLSFGNYNKYLKGPDFNFAAIELDGIKFYGPIEIHVKSSDWYAHKHHLDSNYNSVILHVVYEHDKEVVQDGRHLPVLELKKHIDWKHWEKHKRLLLGSENILCEKSLVLLPDIYIHNMKMKSLVQKLNDRVKLVESYLQFDSEPFYFFIAGAFGSNLNNRAFLNLAQSVPRKQLILLNASQRFKLLISESGILAKDKRIETWHFRGTRPRNFPTVRLKQFSELLGAMAFTKINESIEVKEMIGQLYSELNRVLNQAQLKISESFRNNLIINGLVPFLWFLSNKYQDDRFQDEAAAILTQLKAEDNHIIRKWRSKQISIDTAFDSQGLLALYRYNCCHKKCLSCEVGNQVLKN